MFHESVDDKASYYLKTNTGQAYCIHTHLETFVLPIMALLCRKQLDPLYHLVSTVMLFLFFLPLVAIAINNPNPLKNVVVVGGTHGNEYTGAWVIKSLSRAKDKIDLKYSSLNITTLLGNPEAHIQNKRFIDEDLNRQFSHEALMKDLEKDSANGEHTSYESIRAREINQLLGPKFDDNVASDGQYLTSIYFYSFSRTNFNLSMLSFK